MHFGLDHEQILDERVREARARTRLQGGLSYVQMAFVLIIVAAIGAGLAWAAREIHAYGAAEHALGKAEVMALWSAEALESARDDVEAHRRRQQIAAEAAKTLQAANERADQAEEDLRRKHDGQDNPAVVVEGCTPHVSEGPGGLPVVHFTWSWVLDYDAAWTGAAGKPLFGDRPDAAGAAARADAASPYGPDEVFDVHAINAGKCSKVRRQLNKLLDTLDALEAAEDARLKRPAAAVP